MKLDIRPYLDDLEARLDPETETDLEAQWKNFVSGGLREGVFIPRRKTARPSGLEWPKVPVNDTFEDPDAMLLYELCPVSWAVANGTGTLPNIRSNFGTGILPSIFGCKIMMMPPETDTLPCAAPAEGAPGAPDFNAGLLPRVFEFAHAFREKMAPYPKLTRFVQIYHPDLQGPLDVAEVVRGSGIFLEFYDKPDDIKAFLRVVTDAYCKIFDRWEAEFPVPQGQLHRHWGWALAGKIMLRDDSAMNLSPEMYEEFALPFDRELIGRYGGTVHFCGRGDHYIGLLAGIPNLFAIQLSQPRYNNMPKVYEAVFAHHLRMLDLKEEAVQQALNAGIDLHGAVHCKKQLGVKS